MIANEAIGLLKNAELKQLSVKDDPAAVLGFINLGILELHKRFPLWEEEAIITQVEGTTTYTLDGVDANVIIDLTDHDVLMISSVYNEDDEQYVINNEKDPDSIYTPKPYTIKVPTLAIVAGYEMSVIYRAAPKFLTDDTENIPIPQQFLEALFLFVGYKAHISVKSGLKEENNSHYMRFEAGCKRIKLDGLFPKNDLISTKFEQRGFV